MHLTEEPLKIEKEYLPIQEIGSELKPGMIKAFFPAEIRRMVHVNRHAITANVSKGKNYPTCIVIDADGTKYQFHAVVLQGPAALKYEESPEVAANVFLVTNAGIEAYLDPNAEQFYVQEPPVRKEVKVGLGTRIWRKMLGMVEPVPLLGRLILPSKEYVTDHLQEEAYKEAYKEAYDEAYKGLAARNKMMGINLPAMNAVLDLRIVGC